MADDKYNAVLTLRWVGTVLFWAGVILGSRLFAPPTCAAADREVLIWYVNETAPVDEDLRNYETIIGWLESGETEKAHTFARTLREEMTLFREAVDREQAAIEAGTLASDGRLDAMLITNRLARDGKYRYYDRVTAKFAEAPLDLPPAADDYVLASNPLVRVETLEAVLAEAARRYDPAEHRFVLITKSHGGPEHALAVRLPRHHEDISREQLLAGLAGESEDAPPPPAVGVTKGEYFAALDEAGREHGMRFSLVFMEACRGIFAAGEEQQLPTNVQLLYTSGNRSLQYATLDYPALFEQTGSERTFADALDAWLLPRYMALYREEATNWWQLLWFAPLVILILWSIGRSGRKPPQTNLPVS